MIGSLAKTNLSKLEDHPAADRIASWSLESGHLGDRHQPLAIDFSPLASPLRVSG